jgi:sulfatase maturation enzyme AslB (radical SAM superfamily)
MNAMYKISITNNRQELIDTLQHNLNVYTNIYDVSLQASKILSKKWARDHKIWLNKPKPIGHSYFTTDYQFYADTAKETFEQFLPIINTLKNHLSALNNNNLIEFSIREDEYKYFSIKVDDDLNNWDEYRIAVEAINKFWEEN